MKKYNITCRMVFCTSCAIAVRVIESAEIGVGIMFPMFQVVMICEIDPCMLGILVA